MPGPLVTPYSMALKFVGLSELPGVVHNPAIVAMLQLVDPGRHDDETAWCSAFANYVTWLCGLPRSNSLRARSWLAVGSVVAIEEARPGYDVVILTRGPSPPPANILHAPGHVGFFAEWKPAQRQVLLVGGNQGNRVSMAAFDSSRILGVRRLA